MKQRLQALIVTGFAGFGYLVVMTQWLLVLAVYLGLSSHYNWLDGVTIPSEVPSVAPPVAQPSSFGVFDAVIVVVVVAIMVIVTLYALRQLPGSIVRTGRAVTKVPAEALAPLLLERSNKAHTKRQRLRLTARIVLLLKVFLVALPVAALLPVMLFEYQPLEPVVMWSTALCLAAIAAFSFVVEWGATRVFRLKTEKTR